MDRFELVSIHTSRPVPRDPSAAALGVDGRPRQILILFKRIRGGKGLTPYPTRGIAMSERPTDATVHAPARTL